jgi:hypothetical protein
MKMRLLFYQVESNESSLIGRIGHGTIFHKQGW